MRVKTRRPNHNKIKLKKKTRTKRENKRERERRTRKHPIISRGGKVLGSGGFGCVLSPELKCDEKDLNTGLGLSTRNLISKIMLKRNAVEEYKDIQKYKDIIHKIPNYNKYFIIDNISICAPKKLEPTDLVDYTEKCYALMSKNITAATVNSNLNKLAIINQPNGGIEIDDYITANYLNIVNLKKMNRSLINLLLRGIIPMNKLGLYQLDIKGSNILYDGINSRIIDWGLSVYLSSNISSLNSQQITEISHRPLHFNLPYSIVIFHSHFIQKYEKFLTFSKPTGPKIHAFTLDYLTKLSESENGDYITNIISDISVLFDGKFTINTIATYISGILIEFKDNLDSYFPIFLKNVDVFGFVISYLSFIDNMSKYKQKNPFIPHIKSAFEIIFKYNTRPINIKELLSVLSF